jgi:hypothetical protein
MKTAHQLASTSLPVSGSKPSKPSQTWSEQTEKFMILAFTRMADLFGPKCKAHGLEIRDERGNYTEPFKLWCRKCNGLTPTQITNGMRRVEFDCAKRAQAGDESWPPSYAEFIGLCTANWESRAHKPFEQLSLPDKGAQERAKVAGSSALSDMKSLFGR